MLNSNPYEGTQHHLIKRLTAARAAARVHRSLVYSIYVLNVWKHNLTLCVSCVTLHEREFCMGADHCNFIYVYTASDI